MYSMDQLVKLINDLWQLCFSFWLPNSGLILQLNSVSITPPVQQLSSTLHVQERHDSPIDDRHKVFMASSNETKSLLSAGGKSLIASLGDNSSTQKVCLPCQLHVLWLMFSVPLLCCILFFKLQMQIVASTTAMSSSHGFLRPSRGATSASNFLLLTIGVFLC